MEASYLLQCIIVEVQSNQINNTMVKKKEKGSQLTDKVKENLQLSYGGPGYRQASDTNRV